MNQRRVENDYCTIENLLLLVRKCEENSRKTLHLTANENISSKLSQSYLSSNLSHRYILNRTEDNKLYRNVTIANDFMLKHLPEILIFEQDAYKAANKMFSSQWSDFTPTSGMSAMFSVIMTATNLGDDIHLISHENTGHTATINAIRQLGRKVKILPWCKEAHNIDIDKFQIHLSKNKPKIILFNYSDPLFPLPIKKIRQLCGEECLLIYDSSHTQGLVAGNQFQSPLVEGCDISHGSTHKTFPGPQKGMIQFKDKSIGQVISRKIGNSVISSQHTHHLIALYITMLEMSKFGVEYAAQVISNAKYFAKSLANRGFNVFNVNGNYTETHILLLPFDSKELCFRACNILHECNISTNARCIYNKYYIRLGVQEITRLGMKNEEMELISMLFKKALILNSCCIQIQKEVNQLKEKFQHVHFSFDNKINFER